MNGDPRDLYDLPAETTQDVNNFVMPKRYRREGAREASFMYSGNVRYSIAPALGVRGGFVSCHPA